MPAKFGIRIVCFHLLFFFMALTPSFSASPASPKKVLLVHSYHPEYPWVASITRGVQNALKGRNLTLEIFYMDTKRKTSDEWKAEMGRQARQKIDLWKPDVVITADDNAQIFVAQNYAGKTPNFVFCGVNADPSDYGFPASNITGVIERPYFKESLAYLETLLGGKTKIKHLAVISDNCPTSLGSMGFMRHEKLEAKIEGFRLIENFQNWQARVLQYNREVDALAIYMYHTLKSDQSTLSMAPEDVMNWTIENLTIPTFGFFDFAIRDGILCGVVESGEEYGYEAGKMALALLEGKSIKDLPVITVPKGRGRKMINLKTAKKLGIPIAKELIDQADEVIPE